MSYIDSRDGEAEDPICEYLYWDPLIPRNDLDDAYLLILSSLECAILLFYVFVLLLKKYWICQKRLQKAKQLLLPYYDRIVYYYAFISFIRLIVELCSYALVEAFKFESVFVHSNIEALGTLCIISIGLFIAFLIMQTSVGKNAFHRAIIRTAYVCAAILIFMTFRAIFSENNHQRVYESLSLCIHSLLLMVYLGIFSYSFCIQRRWKRMKRERDRILYRYLFCVVSIHFLYVMAWILELSHVDGYCFLVFGEYAVRIIFPIVAFLTIKSDSQFWKGLIYALQFVSNTSMAIIDGEENEEDDDAENMDKIRMRTLQSDKSDGDRYHHHKFDAKSDEMLLSGNYRRAIGSIFGDDRTENSKQSYYGPLVEALELEINMISYDELYEVSDPFAMGTTAMVHKAKLKNCHGKEETVALKKWILEEIDLSLECITEFFRETLFSNIRHPNLTEFKGACLRPPELCLIYEYMNCGDLARLILLRENREVIRIRNRLHILNGIAKGMDKLHSENIIHRDLKTSNVLVHFDETKQEFIGKVCDFGSARRVQPHTSPQLNASSGSIFSSLHGDRTQRAMTNMSSASSELSQMSHRMTTEVGTIAFMAPEVLSRIDINTLLPPTATPPTKRKRTFDQIRKRTLDLMQKKDSDGYQLMTDSPAVEECDPHATNEWQTVGVMDSKTSTYNESVDIFAFGVIMYEVGFLERVYEGMDLVAIYNRVIRGERMAIPTYEQCQKGIRRSQDGMVMTMAPSGFYRVSETVYDSYIKLMTECWSHDERLRPKFSDICDRLKHIDDIRSGKHHFAQHAGDFQLH